MDLQSIGCKAVTSANAWLAITSVRIPHKQPSPTGANRTLPGACPLPLVVAIEGRVCRLSPVHPPTDAYSLRGSYTHGKHSTGRHLPPQPRQFSSVSMAGSRSCMPKMRPCQRLPRRLSGCRSEGGCLDAHSYWFNGLMRFEL